MHADAEELAVPFGEHALDAARIRVGVVDRQRGGLHPLWRVDAGDAAERRRKIDEADGPRHDRGVDVRARRRPPDQRQPHQRVDVVRPFEQQTEVALQLAVVGREHDVDVVVPAARADGREHAAECLVDQLALDGVAAFTSRTWSAVSVAGTHCAGAS